MERVKIEVLEDRIHVDAGFRDKENIKLVPGARWDTKKRYWHAPLSWAAMQQFRGVFGDRLEIGPQLLELATEVKANRVDPAMALRVAPDCEWIREYCQHSNGRDELSPLQRAAAAFMAVGRQTFEGDPMGSGKTPITICALRFLVEHMQEDVFPLFIVCNNGAKVHWRDEFAAWWPDVDVSVVQGGLKTRRKQLEPGRDVYVLNWEGLAAHTRLSGYGNIKLKDKEKEPKELNEMELKGVIADEVHRAKNPKAKQTRAMFAITDPVAKAGSFVGALTGSLIANSPVDLWAPGRVIAPSEYPSKTAFVERYGLLSWNYFGSMQVVGLRGDTRQELYSFLDPRFIRRPKEAILPELVGKLPPIVRTVDLPAKQRKAYNKLKEEMLVELDNGVLTAKNPMTRMQRLRHFAGATGDIDKKGELIMKEPSSKLDELVNVLEELGDDQVAVYAESRKLIELAAERLAKEAKESGRLPGITFAQYTGKVDVNAREESRKEFQEGKVRVLLLTYGAGSESINLSKADALVQLELSWSAIKNSQALERPQRMGRKGPLRQISIVAADTVDDTVSSKYRDKLDMLEEVVRDEEALKLWLS